MKKKFGRLTTIYFVIFTFVIIFNCAAAELSSGEIKNIENGIKDIKSEARGTQSRGYETLKASGAPAAPYIIELLRDKSASRETRALACDLLGTLKAEGAIPDLIYTLKDKSFTTRAAACKALGLIGDPKAIKPLLGMLSDEEADVREASVKALVNFNDDAIPQQVEKLLGDNIEYVRLAAANLLYKKLDHRTAKGMRQALTSEKNNSIRLVIIKALGELKDKEAVDLLSEAATEDRDQLIREAAVVSLGKIGDKKAIPSLIAALKDDYKDVQLRASYSLKDLTGENFGRDHDKWSQWFNGQKKVTEDGANLLRKEEGMEQTQNIEKNLSESQWYLGEEKARNQQLENDLQGKNQYIQKLETDLKNLWQQYNESQWYLTEEKTKREQSDAAFKDSVARCKELESQLDQLRSQLQIAQRELKEEQAFTGGLRAKHLK